MTQTDLHRGTLVTYEDNLLNADEHIVECNNYTEILCVDVLKTCVKERPSAKYLDRNMFIELVMMLLPMRESDQNSKIENKRFLQVLPSWPFSTIFFTEYSSSARYSYIYVDATGSVVKPLPDQNKPYLYVVRFKNGEDPSNLLLLAGALLTDHPHGYIVIDFSPALLNVSLFAINNTNIHAYLRWCFNAIQKNYTFE